MWCVRVVCACMHIHLYAQEHGGECMCMYCMWQPKIGMGYLPQHLSTLFWGSGYLTAPGTHQFRLTGWPISARDLPEIACTESGLQACGKSATLYTDAGDKNSGFYAQATSASQTQSSLQPLNVVFCMENRLTVAMIQTECVCGGGAGGGVGFENGYQGQHEELSCWDIMFKLFKI